MEKKQQIDRQAEIERETYFLPQLDDVDLMADQDARAEEKLYEGDAGGGNGYTDNTTAWD